MLPYLADSDPSDRYLYANDVLDRDPLTNWLAQRQQRAAVQLHGSLRIGWERLSLAATRCKELQAEIDEARSRLLNLPWFTPPGIALSLEERALKLTSELHAERVATWASLRELAEPIQDAGLERLRTSWLSAFEHVESERGGT